jgi:ATP-dependent Clp protease ATP-binding subunit ClpC
MDTSMALGQFNYKSMRAEKARIGAGMTPALISLLSVCTVLLLVSGIIFVALAMAIGWTLIGFSAIAAMVIEWKKGELVDLHPDPAGSSIDGLLAGDVLGQLSRSPSPYELASIVGRVYSGQFFAVRFGIGVRFLQEIASKDSADTDIVWQHARDIQAKVGANEVSAGVLAVALVRAYPNYETMLAHLQLSIDDLIAGIVWQRHIDDLIKQHNAPRRTGGVARDWSFGWIPSLSRFGQNISQQIASGGLLSVKLESHQQALDQLVTQLASQGRGNAVLVGPDGVGKTEIVHALAERLLDASADLPPRLRFRQIFILDASSLIAAAPKRGELESLLMRLMSEAYSAKNIIICLDNAQLFFEDSVGSVDLTNVLLPVIEAGRLPLILAMDEQRYLQISNRNARLTNSLNRITVLPPTQPETMAVMQDQLITIEFRQHVTYMYQAIQEVYRLSERYIHDLVMPGRAVTLLQLAAHYAENGIVTAVSVRLAIEKSLDIKVGTAQTDDERQKLLNLESLIHKRMINQTRAVSVVSDALRRARAGVRNQDRPIGTFLFLGPTGVGKTELAKALADVYFGGEDRIIRLDMNEFVSSGDVQRLIADGADDGGSLTARVMKQPFSVILLDEIEKAHPHVLTTFLQLLDEGILRDVKNREVSFRDAIIIATSNAGSDRIREQIARGLDVEQFEDQFVDELISSNQFKPEFLNRFDEIVMFKPLNKGELLQVVDLILLSVNKTLALQKVSVVVDADAKEYLVDAGYDPRLGARPMRRIVQRAVENTVAKQVLAGEVGPGGTVTITLDQVRTIVTSKSQADAIVDAVS